MSYHGEKQAMGRIDDLEQAIDATHRALCGCTEYDPEDQLKCLTRKYGPGSCVSCEHAQHQHIPGDRCTVEGCACGFYYQCEAAGHPYQSDDHFDGAHGNPVLLGRCRCGEQLYPAGGS